MRVATISNLEDRTDEDERTGAVRSIQAADLSLPEATLRGLWTSVNLERLARTYWRFLTRVTLGLVRVRYSQTERSLVLIARPLKLLTFAAPEYEMDARHGLVRWRIARGLLVARRGRGDGYLQIEVRRCPHGPCVNASPGDHADARADGTAGVDLGTGVDTGAGLGEQSSATPGAARLHVEVEVAGFYPAIASRLGRRVYGMTQSRVHVLITRSFLRSLARLDLAESRVGKLNGVGDS